MPHERKPTYEQLAVGLGLFSVGLGLAEILAPGAIARLAGLPREHRANGTVRAMGLRELANGLVILSRPDAPVPMWGRVAGDVADLALLSRVAMAPGAHRGRTAAATAAVLGISVLDAFCAARLQASQEDAPRRIDAAAAATIARPIDEVYGFWQNIEAFPHFLRNLASVEDLGEGHSRWRVNGPAGVPVSWEAVIVSDQENHMISWRSLPDSWIDNRGAVRFEPAPGGRGTEVHAEISYAPPAGDLGHAAAWLFGQSPRQQMREGLRRIKQLLELGEIPLSDGPGISRPAQPAETPGTLRDLAGVRS
jgi:uncharacterized membrane protein